MNNKIKYTMGERIFQAANTVFMLLILLITLYPFYYAVIASISDGSELVRGNVLFLPVKPTLEAYTLIPGIKNFFLAYGNTIFYTVAGAIISLVVMSMGRMPCPAPV